MMSEVYEMAEQSFLFFLNLQEVSELIDVLPL